MSNPRISIITPAFNSGPYLEDCVASLAEAVRHYGGAELIVVDNGSTDGSYETMQQLFGHQARILQVPKVTIGALRNRGAKTARGEFLSFVDSDCRVDPDFLSRAMRVFDSVEADAAGCEYALPENPLRWEETWHYLHWPTEDGYQPYRYFAGNLVIRKSVFEKIGGFNETLVTGEDAELGLRLVGGGFKVFRAPDLLAYHMGNPKTIGRFFRKEIWHGLGMLGSLKTDLLDKPLIMTFLHLLLTVAGIVGVVLIPAGWLVRLALLVLPTLVAPFLTALYRGYQRGRLYRLVTSTLLYHLYYDARIIAMLKVLLGLA
ncbi:MAG: glycosyltransferase [Terriglobales bacterium]